MIKEGKFVIFKADCDKKGKEILNSTQRNNEIVYPDPKEFPNASYRTSWKNTCNVTSMVMGLEYSGFSFPKGEYKQPEDNLADFILKSPKILELYKKEEPVMYQTWIDSFNGPVYPPEIYPPTEIHKYLSLGTNLWMGKEITFFDTKVDFKSALHRNIVIDNLPIVVSTNFGGFGHIVTVVGAKYNQIDILNSFGKVKSTPQKPVSIFVDDPWGKYNPNTNKYDAPNGGNNIEIPWDVVVAKLKPYGSPTEKWCHQFKHSVEVI